MTLDWQEVVALAIVAVAALYLVRVLTGWPPKKPRSNVVIGDRLKRGLEDRDE